MSVISGVSNLTNILPKYVNNLREFQNLGLINKAVLDVTAVDVPLVVLSKNPTERAERTFRQGLVLLFAFLLAPLHSKMVARHIGKKLSKKLQLPNKIDGENLLQVSYTDLKNNKTVKDSIKKLYKDILEEDIPDKLLLHNAEYLRKSILKSKVQLNGIDLMIEGVAFALIGPLKVLFGKLISGQDKFTGELNLASDDDLDALYEAEQANAKQNNIISKNFKQLITLGLGLAVPSLVSHTLYKSHLKSKNNIFTKYGKLFDYNYPTRPAWLKKLKVPMLSNIGLVIASLIITLGELASARSSREFQELFIQRNAIDFTFFVGVPLTMKLLNKGFITIDQSINSVKNQLPTVVRRTAKTAANNYIISYLATIGLISGIITYTNSLTRKNIQKELDKLPD